MVVYLVGDDRIDVLAVGSAGRSPAWIEASVGALAESGQRWGNNRMRNGQ